MELFQDPGGPGATPFSLFCSLLFEVLSPTNFGTVGLSLKQPCRQCLEASLHRISLPESKLPAFMFIRDVFIFKWTD